MGAPIASAAGMVRPGFPDFSAHQRNGLDAGPCEGNRRPKYRVVEAKAGNDAVSIEGRRGPGVPPVRNPEHHEQCRRRPARVAADVGQPFRHRHAAQVQRERDQKSAQRETDEISGRGAGHRVALTRPVQGTARREIEHAGKVRQIRGPVRPARHEARERPERAFAPDIQAALVGITRRQETPRIPTGAGTSPGRRSPTRAGSWVRRRPRSRTTAAPCRR